MKIELRLAFPFTFFTLGRIFRQSASVVLEVLVLIDKFNRKKQGKKAYTNASQSIHSIPSSVLAGVRRESSERTMKPSLQVQAHFAIWLNIISPTSLWYS